MATHGCAEVTDGFDTLIVAGGEGVEQARADPTLVAWAKKIAPRVRRVVSVCAGAFLLATAGLSNNRRVTTHWMFCERLAAAFPSLRVEPNLIFVRDGHIYTSGGITSGIDLALALIEEDLGQEVPRLVAGTMVVFLRRPGGQTQFSPFLLGEAKNRYDIRQLQAFILAHSRGVQRRDPRRPYSDEQAPLPVETIAEICGFGTAERMRRSFQRLLNVNPHDYRARFQSALLN